MAKSIMIQGTMSNVGKSIITAGLCRIFTQDGYEVAPFKSQNMALNSYVTADGLEMSRAQVLQAAACGKLSDVRMNPILLKPTGDMGSQVIVEGRSIGDYRAVDYFKLKSSLIPDIIRCYDSLSGENDIIVIEGAGSPAEINLRADDIVNMGLAELVDAPVILVGDIDPGGVFAQLYGTLELLAESERARVVGTVINKFRGDLSLLQPGLAQIEELTGVPVLGVVPYIKLTLDDEDSLSLDVKKHAERPLDVAVIRLPLISNHTDLTPLTLHPAIAVRFVSDPKHLGEPDLIILPGTKNTISDLRWLKKSGIFELIKAARCPILGICGGYQMLGELISDPVGVEAGGSEKGLGLIPVETVFEEEKINKLCKASGPGGCEIRGYQIHNGQSRFLEEGTVPFCRLSDGSAEGIIYGKVFGTYLHGLFDTGEFTAYLADFLLERKGLSPMGFMPDDYRNLRETELDRLAAALRGSLDLKTIYRSMR